MNATRSKRWNGNIDTLPAEYLSGVMAKMVDYGDQVQFSLISNGPLPSYQVVNTLDKKMVFDRNHHLLRDQSDDFVGQNASAVFTLDQIKARISGVGNDAGGARSRTVRGLRAGSGGTRTTAAAIVDQLASQRYEYFKNNRQTLPPTISNYSDEIDKLMKDGRSAEDAFAEVIKKYF